MKRISDTDGSRRPLAGLPAGTRQLALDLGTVGLGFGLLSLIAAVVLFGVAPMALGLGLLALLVID